MLRSSEFKILNSSTGPFEFTLIFSDLSFATTIMSTLCRSQVCTINLGNLLRYAVE